MRNAIDDELHWHDLTGAQSEVLRHLWHHDQLEQRTLQERLGITSPTLTGIVGRAMLEYALLLVLHPLRRLQRQTDRRRAGLLRQRDQSGPAPHSRAFSAHTRSMPETHGRS